MQARLAALIGGFIMSAAAPAGAQPPPDFPNLRIRAGDLVYVTDTAVGVEVRGRVKTLSPFELTIDGYHFKPAPGLKIQRQGDRVWDGVLIGMGIGALLGAAGLLPKGASAPPTLAPSGSATRVAGSSSVACTARSSTGCTKAEQRFTTRHRQGNKQKSPSEVSLGRV